MAKKNWIFIKRGLSEDPKHREAMSEIVRNLFTLAEKPEE